MWFGWNLSVAKMTTRVRERLETIHPDWPCFYLFLYNQHSHHSISEMGGGWNDSSNQPLCPCKTTNSSSIRHIKWRNSDFIIIIFRTFLKTFLKQIFIFFYLAFSLTFFEISCAVIWCVILCYDTSNDYRILLQKILNIR